MSRILYYSIYISSFFHKTLAFSQNLFLQKKPPPGIPEGGRINQLVKPKLKSSDQAISRGAEERSEAESLPERA